MDLLSLSTARERRGRVVARAFAFTPALLVAAWLAFRVDVWNGVHYSVAMLAIGGVLALEWRMWTWRSVERSLDLQARALGLAPASLDSRLYEGVSGRGTVRVWIGDVDRGSTESWLLMAAVGAGTGASFWMDELRGPVVSASIAVAVMLWMAWRTRPMIEIEGVYADGRRRRTQVRHRKDLEYAIAVLPGEPATEERPSVLPGIDAPHLLARVQRSRSEEVVLSALSALAASGSARELGPLADALRRRVGGLSPRIALAGSEAAARIRERDGAPEIGALALGDLDDRVGRIGVVGEIGAVSEPEVNDE